MSSPSPDDRDVAYVDVPETDTSNHHAIDHYHFNAFMSNGWPEIVPSSVLETDDFSNSLVGPAGIWDSEEPDVIREETMHEHRLTPLDFGSERSVSSSMWNGGETWASIQNTGIRSHVSPDNSSGDASSSIQSPLFTPNARFSSLNTIGRTSESQFSSRHSDLPQSCDDESSISHLPSMGPSADYSGEEDEDDAWIVHSIIARSSGTPALIRRPISNDINFPQSQPHISKNPPSRVPIMPKKTRFILDCVEIPKGFPRGVGRDEYYFIDPPPAKRLRKDRATVFKEEEEEESPPPSKKRKIEKPVRTKKRKVVLEGHASESGFGYHYDKSIDTTIILIDDPREPSRRAVSANLRYLVQAVGKCKAIFESTDSTASMSRYTPNWTYRQFMERTKIGEETALDSDTILSVSGPQVALKRKDESAPALSLASDSQCPSRSREPSTSYLLHSKGSPAPSSPLTSLFTESSPEPPQGPADYTPSQSPDPMLLGAPNNFLHKDATVIDPRLTILTPTHLPSEGQQDWSDEQWNNTDTYNDVYNPIETINPSLLITPYSQTYQTYDHPPLPDSPLSFQYTSLSSPPAIDNQAEVNPDYSIHPTATHSSFSRLSPFSDDAHLINSISSTSKMDDNVPVKAPTEKLSGLCIKKPTKRVLWPTGKTEYFCHQCRTRSFKLSMVCRDCEMSYCIKCITVRYSDTIEFDAETENFLCPKCLDECCCDICCRRRGEDYISMKKGVVVNSRLKTCSPEPSPASPLILPDVHGPVKYWGTLYTLGGDTLGASYVGDGGGEDVVVVPKGLLHPSPARNSPKMAKRETRLYAGILQPSWGLKRIKEYDIVHPNYQHCDVLPIRRDNSADIPGSRIARWYMGDPDVLFMPSVCNQDDQAVDAYDDETTDADLEDEYGPLTPSDDGCHDWPVSNIDHPSTGVNGFPYHSELDVGNAIIAGLRQVGVFATLAI